MTRPDGGERVERRQFVVGAAEARAREAARARDDESVDGPRSHELASGRRGSGRGRSPRRRWNVLAAAAAMFLALGGLGSARGVDLVPGRSRVLGPRIHWMMLRGGGGEGGEAGTDKSEQEDGGELSNLMEEAGDRDNDPEAEEMQRGRGLWFAAEEGDEEELDEWVARGADVNSTAHVQLNAGAPLHWAAMKGRLGAIVKLLNLGADVNGRSKKDNQVCDHCMHWQERGVGSFNTTARQRGNEQACTGPISDILLSPSMPPFPCRAENLDPAA